MPRTLTCASSAGRATETRTSICAARWKQTVGWSRAKSSVVRLADVALDELDAVGTGSRACRTRGCRSRTTSSPRARSASATCEPMKPAPPVTTPAPSYPRRDVRDLRGPRRLGQDHPGELLAERLEEAGREVVATREPGGTPLGERVRELLLGGPTIAPWAEAALFAAARAELVERGHPAGARARSGRRLRPLPRLVARVPGHRARPRRRPRARAEPRAIGRPPPRRDLPAAPRARRGGARCGPPTDRIEREGEDVPARRRRGLPRARRDSSPSGSSTSTRSQAGRGGRAGGPVTASRAFLSRPRPSACSTPRCRGAGARLPLPRAAGRREAPRRARLRGGAARRPRAASSGARIPTSTCSSRSATRSASTRSARSATTSTCGRSRPTAASTSSSARTC